MHRHLGAVPGYPWLANVSSHFVFAIQKEEAAHIAGKLHPLFFRRCGLARKKNVNVTGNFRHEYQRKFFFADPTTKCSVKYRKIYDFKIKLRQYDTKNNKSRVHFHFASLCYRINESYVYSIRWHLHWLECFITVVYLGYY